MELTRRDLLATAPIGLVGIGAMDPSITGPATPGSGLIFSTAIIRLYSSGPEVYDNAGHAALGDMTVDINANGNLEITRTPGGAIAYVAATIDESLARRGIIAGCSGGSVLTIVQLYDTDTQRVVRPDSSAVASPTSNLWMLWIDYPIPASLTT